MTWLPHRLSWQSVQRYTNVIRVLCESYPTLVTVSFSPKDLGLATETALNRFRDAIQSLSTGKTTDPSINAETLRTLWPLYKVTVQGETVVVSPRVTKKETPQISVGVGTPTPSGLLAVLTADEPRFVETLTAFAVLLGTRKLEGQVEIVGPLSLELQNQLMTNNDIAITKQPDSKHIML